MEVDEFHGANEGLTVAEIELDDENEPFANRSGLARKSPETPDYLNCNLHHRAQG